MNDQRSRRSGLFCPGTLFRAWDGVFLSTTLEPTQLEYALPDSRPTGGFLGIATDTWLRVGVITALFAAVFWPNIRRLWLKDNPITGEDNWKHGLFVPVVGLYYLFVHREELSKAGARQFIWGPFLRPSRAVSAGAMVGVGLLLMLVSSHGGGLIFAMLKAGSYALTVMGALVFLLDWSLATTLFGIGFYVYGIYPGQNDYLKDVGMIICLFGIVLLLTGPGVMKIAWFPIVFLICAIPWPGLVYSWIAEPLQQTAAKVAVHVLNMTGVDSFCNGTKIVMLDKMLQPMRVLNVAEACAGMRSLMTFISVAGAIAFLSSRPLWEKVIIVASSIPIAIFCNMTRISGQGLLDHYVSPQWSESFAHQFVGMMMLLPAFFMILGVGFVLDKMFIEEADDDSTPPAVRVVAIAPRKEIDNTGRAMNPVQARIVPPTSTTGTSAPVVAAVLVKPATTSAGPTTLTATSRPNTLGGGQTVLPATNNPRINPVPGDQSSPIPPAVAKPSTAGLPPRPEVVARPAANPKKEVTVAKGMTPVSPAPAAKQLRMPPPPPGSVLRRSTPVPPRIIDAPAAPKAAASRPVTPTPETPQPPEAHQ